MLHRIKIETDKENPAHKRVFLDEQELHGVTGVDVRLRVDEVPGVKLNIVPNTVDIDLVDADVVKTPDVDALLSSPIEYLDLSTRSYNALKRGVVRIHGETEHDTNRTVRDVLIRYRAGRLKYYTHLGVKSLKEIEDTLISKGLIKGEEA